MRRHSLLQKSIVLGGMLLASVPLMGSNCGGGSWDSPTVQNTYRCACTCPATTGVYSPNPSYYEVVYPSEDLRVCAASPQAAEFSCSYACAGHVEKRWDRYNLDNSLTGACTVDSADEIDHLACTSSTTSTSTYALVSMTPEYATFEGPIDFGISTMDLQLLALNDEVFAHLQGNISVVGGNCPGASCPIEVNFARFSPYEGDLQTDDGRSLTDILAINEGLWTGTMNPDGTLTLDPSSKLTVSGYMDGKHVSQTIGVSNSLTGRIVYGMSRLTNSGVDKDNALIINGTFGNGDLSVKLHLQAWMTDCKPEIDPHAQCWGGVEQQGTTERYLLLNSSYSILGNLSGADLCEAMATDDPGSVCAGGGDPEFPHFWCESEDLSSLTPIETATRLSFKWTDANGKVLGTDKTAFLTYMPKFPVTLEVRNEFGRTATETIQTAPTGTGCPSPFIFRPIKPIVIRR